MDMKWYAMPSVSNMLVDIGGVQFCGCPFNGWFMGTEVARDLLDVSRYDLLQVCHQLCKMLSLVRLISINQKFFCEHACYQADVELRALLNFSCFK